MKQHLLELIAILRENNKTLATAESCTGGLLSAMITEIPNTSTIFERGFVTYSNQAKQDLLDVPSDTLETHGAVSQQTATKMAQGALKNSAADIAVSITGIAGPAGGSDEKPIGTVYIGCAIKNKSAESVHHQFTGSRTDIRNQSCEAALKQLIETLKSP